MNDESVAFRYQDYRDGQQKVMTLAGPEFLRRYLQHVLPHGFMRIRHFGWLANACRCQQLPSIRQAIAAFRNGSVMAPDSETSRPNLPPSFEGIPFPDCKISLLRVCGRLPPTRLEYG